METESTTPSSGLTAVTGECTCGNGSLGKQGCGCTTTEALGRLRLLSRAVVDAWDSCTREDLDDAVDALWKELTAGD